MLMTIIVLIILAGGIYFFARYKSFKDFEEAFLTKFNSKGENQPKITNTRFKTLLGYGKLISGLGWILFVIGILMIISVFE